MKFFFFQKLPCLSLDIKWCAPYNKMISLLTMYNTSMNIHCAFTWTQDVSEVWIIIASNFLKINFIVEEGTGGNWVKGHGTVGRQVGLILNCNTTTMWGTKGNCRRLNHGLVSSDIFRWCKKVFFFFFFVFMKVMQKVRQCYWTAAYCKQWCEKLGSFIGLQYIVTGAKN